MDMVLQIINNDHFLHTQERKQGEKWPSLAGKLSLEEERSSYPAMTTEREFPKNTRCFIRPGSAQS